MFYNGQNWWCDHWFQFLLLPSIVREDEPVRRCRHHDLQHRGETQTPVDEPHGCDYWLREIVDVSCINRVVRGHPRCWHAARAAAFRKPTALRPRRYPANYPSPLRHTQVHRRRRPFKFDSVLSQTIVAGNFKGYDGALLGNPSVLLQIAKNLITSILWDEPRKQLDWLMQIFI